MTDADPTMVSIAEMVDAVYGESQERPTVKPREEVARAACSFYARFSMDLMPEWPHLVGDERTEYLDLATAVLNRLRELGAFNDQFYAAVRAEEKAK